MKQKIYKYKVEKLFFNTKVTDLYIYKRSTDSKYGSSYVSYFTLLILIIVFYV